MRLVHNVSALAASLALCAMVACSKDPNVAKRRSFDRANQYAAQKKLPEAIIEYRNAIQIDPKFGEAHFKLAEAYAEAGDVANGFREFMRAGDLLPNDVDAQLRVGGILHLTGHYEEAKARAENVLKKQPKHVGALILRANALARLKNLDSAAADIDEVIRTGADPRGAYSNLALIEIARGKKEEAEAAFKKALDAAPQSVSAHLALATYYWVLGRTADAEASYKRAIAIAPADVDANRSLATFYVLNNRAIEAERPLKVLAETSKDPVARLTLADYYITAKRSNDALGLLEALAKEKDSFVEATERLALLETQQGHANGALRLLDAVLKDHPKNATALMLKGRLTLNAGKPDEALALTKKAIAADPKNFQAYFLLGGIYLAKHQPEQAIASLSEVLKIRPRSPETQVELARLYLGRGDAEAAVRFAGDAVANQPQNPQAHLLLAEALIAKGDLHQAETQLKALQAAFPKQAEIPVQLGRLALSRKDSAAARTYFTRATELDASSDDALAGLITLDLAERKMAEARTRVEAQLAKKSRDVQLLFLAASVYDASGDVSNRERVLRQVVELDSANVDAYANLGLMYFKQRKLGEARTEFEELVKRQPTAAAPRTMLAYILQLQGRRADARAAYEKVLELDPNSAIAANNLAWLQAEDGGNLDVALQLAQTAKSKMPDRPEFAGTLGWIYYKKDLPTLAVRELRESVQADPKNPVYQYHLGLAYAKTGDKEKAREHLGQALKVKPDFEEAADVRKALASL